MQNAVAAAEGSGPLLSLHNMPNRGARQGRTRSPPDSPSHPPSSSHSQPPVLASASSARGEGGEEEAEEEVEEEDDDDDNETARLWPTSADTATPSWEIGKKHGRRNRDYTRASGEDRGEGDHATNNDDDDESTRDQRHWPSRSSQGKPDKPRPRRPHGDRFSCSVGRAFGVILVCFVIVASIWALCLTWIESTGQGLAGKDDRIDGTLDDWGKPGTGTEALARYPADFLRDVVAVPCHSHNDYWRRVPLFSAIGAGCTSVEADVWLRDDGELSVGHDRASLQRSRTLRSLYVDPLVGLLQRINSHGGDRRGIFDTDPDQTLTLLIEVKTDGAATWPVVMQQLQPLRDGGWLSRYYERGDEFHPGPVTVVGTGLAPFDAIAANTSYRDAFYDAPLDALAEKYDWRNSYYASTSFDGLFGPVVGPEQLATVKKQIETAHERGLKARYWETPAWPIHVRNRIWAALVEAGADVLNVDDLEGATKTDWGRPSPPEEAVQ